MNRRTIDMAIRHKMKAWWESIKNDELKEAVERDTIVTGGCIASMLLNEPPSDYDVYLATRSTAESLAHYYVASFMERNKDKALGFDIRIDANDERIKIICQSSGIASETSGQAQYEYFESRPPEEAQDYIGEVMGEHAGDLYDTDEATEKEAQEVKGGSATGKFRPVYLSTNAITLADKVQVVVRFFGPPEEIHKNYDFVHCKNYWTKETGVVLLPDSLESLLTKELRYVGSRFPLCSIIRTRKFMKRGWFINAGQYVKMALQISDLDLRDRNVLEDQLIGVDQAYFRQVIEEIDKQLAGSDDTKLDSAYLIELIDKIF